jgi:hypothetical protein
LRKWTLTATAKYGTNGALLRAGKTLNSSTGYQLVKEKTCTGDIHGRLPAD